MQDIEVEKQSMHPSVDRLEHFPALHDPAREHCAGQLDSEALEVLFLSIERHRLDELLAHYIRESRSGCQALGNQRLGSPTADMLIPIHLVPTLTEHV